MIDKNYCMSSYLAFRYIDKNGIDFADTLHHHNIELPVDAEKTLVNSASDIGCAIKSQLSLYSNKRCGILLSGGMDSAIVASYMNGGDAYTFRFIGGSMFNDELSRAEYYAKVNSLTLHYVDIDWNVVMQNIDECMRHKCSPVHSIEPQIVQAATQAKADGIDVMLIGDGSDYRFGGMDQLLSRDWLFDEFVERYISANPKRILKTSSDITYAFEPYRVNSKYIDFVGFMNNLMTRESFNSYYNAFTVACLQYFDPYARLKPATPIDLHRIRCGEPKYWIRELMAMRYPNIPIPNKVPMPRPVDYYFQSMKPPRRDEFRTDIEIDKFSGNQKWQLWCLNRFLEQYC